MQSLPNTPIINRNSIAIHPSCRRSCWLLQHGMHNRSGSSSRHSSSAPACRTANSSSRAQSQLHRKILLPNSCPFNSSSNRSSWRRRATPPAAAATVPEPDLSALKKSSDLERLLFAQMQQAGGAGSSSSGPGAGKPNAPVTPGDFVEALEMVVRSSGQAVNPEQLDDIFSELLDSDLLGSFSPTQLAVTVKNLGVLCKSVRTDLLEALLPALAAHMGAFDVRQLAAVAWGLMRLVPVASQEARESVGMDQAWLNSYAAAVEQQLEAIRSTQQQQQQHQAGQQQETSQQQEGGQEQQADQQPDQQQQQQQPGVADPLPKLPSAQQLANLLLLPAAAMQPPAPSLLLLLEEVLVLRSVSLCGYAVAQLLTCYVRLGLQPGPQLLATLLEHLAEETQLYDYDELTQVAFGVWALRLQLPDALLADITQRAGLLEASGQAAPSDMAVLQEALQRLSAEKAAAAAAAARA